MVTRMEVDIEIDDELHAAAEQAAGEDGTTISALAEDGLRKVLDERRGRQPVNES